MEMEEHKDKDLKEGFVPPKKPLKPQDIDKKGFVPPSSPEKPPQKPDRGKK
jgi:hypothetical protein